MDDIKVLFIGGTGVISASVSALLSKQPGIELYLLNRGIRNPGIPEGAIQIKADVENESELAAAISQIEFDCVVDWIAYTTDQVARDIRLFTGRTGQYIFISSASAYRRPPQNYIITEDTPLENPYWQYSRDKIACEKLLESTAGFPYTVVRPNYTYDKTMIPYVFNSRKRRYTLVDRMRRGKKIIVPGDGTSLFTITHSRDLAVGFAGLVGSRAAIGQAYHITSDEVRTWDYYAKMIGEAAGAAPDILHVPSDLICTVSPENTGGLLGDKSYSAIYDNGKIKGMVPGFEAVISFREGIKETIDWYDSNPDLCVTDPEFDILCDELAMRMENAYHGTERGKS